jgi:hypothetical protein
VDFGTQYAMRMAILSSVVCPTLQYFSISSHYRQDFRKQIFEREKFFLFSLQILPEIFIFLRRIEGDIIKNAHPSLFKVTDILVRL